MNFRTESFDFPQKEQRRCLSCDMRGYPCGADGRIEELLLELMLAQKAVKHE